MPSRPKILAKQTDFSHDLTFFGTIPSAVDPHPWWSGPSPGAP
jgi:hypothetical protein